MPMKSSGERMIRTRETSFNAETAERGGAARRGAAPAAAVANAIPTWVGGVGDCGNYNMSTSGGASRSR